MKKSSCLLVFIWLLGCGTEIKSKIEIVPNSKTGKDAIIARAYETNNYGDLEILHLISRIKNDTIKDDNRFVLSFDMEHIDRKAKIDSAFIYLYANTHKNYGENSFYIQRITYPWAEHSITWKNQPKVDTTNQIFVNGTKNGFQDYKIDVTPFVKNSINRKYRNLGFMFKLVNENLEDKRLNFFSSNYFDNNKRPKLEIYLRIKE